ncbi:hypothetical protein GCM10022252_75810 [Streptosporangium oxazolinicum]|uniref:Uncharacterized protein n=1 Tax=Streptosporangium oxazolinicum TaxID=909287 RepID=A0ABP8BKS8_9ACTN
MNAFLQHLTGTHPLWLYLAGLLVVFIASGRPARDYEDAYDLDDISEALDSIGYGWALITAVCAFVVVGLMVVAWGLWAIAHTSGALAIATLAFAWQIDRLALRRPAPSPELTPVPA